VSCTVGSSDPPLRTTFLGGGQGFNAAEPEFVEPGLVEAELVEPVPVEPAPVELVEPAGSPTGGFSAVGAGEQFGVLAFL
jgi:hypothetical protein